MCLNQEMKSPLGLEFEPKYQRINIKCLAGGTGHISKTGQPLIILMYSYITHTLTHRPSPCFAT